MLQNETSPGANEQTSKGLHEQTGKEAGGGTAVTPSGGAIPPATPPTGGSFAVGVVFSAVLILFLIVAYFKKGMTRGQWIIIRVLSTICAGFAAGFMSGGLITNISVPLPGGGDVNVDAVGGLGVAVIIWFTFPRLFEEPEVSINITPGAAFERIATLAADEFHETIDLSQLTPEELSAPLREGELRAGSTAKFVNQLRLRTVKPNAVRPYQVKRSKGGVNILEVS